MDLRAAGSRLKDNTHTNDSHVDVARTRRPPDVPVDHHTVPIVRIERLGPIRSGVTATVTGIDRKSVV